MTEQVVKVWTRDDVVDLINTRDDAVIRAIVQLHARQTADEQQTRQTKERNGRGFNANDAPFLSDIAKKLPRYNNRMTPQQIAKARPMLRKYARQLLEIIEENGGKVDFGKPRNSENAAPAPSDAAAPPAVQEQSPADVISSLWGQF